VEVLQIHLRAVQTLRKMMRYLESRQVRMDKKAEVALPLAERLLELEDIWIHHSVPVRKLMKTNARDRQSTYSKWPKALRMEAFQ